MKECVNCKATLEDDELFCHECGTKQVIEQSEAQAEEQSVPEGMKCSHCGETIEEDSLFCPYCGKTQDVEKTKNEEPQPEAEEAEPQQEVSQPEEEPTYEYEEEKKSKTWLWILILFLLVGGGAGWYYFTNTSSDDPITEELEDTGNEPTAVVTEENEEDDEVLAFVKEFYKHYMDEDYLYAHVTKSVLDKLYRDYPYECEDGTDCLATWVFQALPHGVDMELEEGPVITQVNKYMYDVKFKYLFISDGQRQHEDRSIRLYVDMRDGAYKITTYVFDDKTQAPRHDYEKLIKEIPEGKYNLSLADMHMVMEVHDSIVEGYYYFKAGTSQTTNIDFAGKADNGLELHLNQRSVSGKDLGYIKGTFDGKTFKGTYDTEDGRWNEFVLYVGGE